MLRSRPLTSLAHIGLFAILPGAAIGGGLALAVLVGTAGAASLNPGLLRQVFEKRPPTALILVAAFIFWAVLSSAWSRYPDHIQALKLAAICVLGVGFAAAATRDGAARRLTRAGTLAALLVLAALMTIELWGAPLNRAVQPELDDWMLMTKPATGSVIFSALVWPAAAGLWARGMSLAAIMALAIAGAFATQFDQLSNLLAFAGGLCAFALALAWPRLGLWLSVGLCALWVLIAPYALPLLLADPSLTETAPLSWAERIGIWKYVSAHIADAPLIGHGLDASRAVHDRILVHGEEIRAISLHPHSASLQIWYETGAVGAVLAAAALLAGAQALARAYADNRPAAAAAAGAIMGIFISANLSYGLWQEWWNALMFLSAAAIGAAGAVKAARA